MAIIDGIISNPGVLVPWKELVNICKEEGIWSVIDAAHSIGQEQNIDLTEAAPDFWTSVRDKLILFLFLLVQDLVRSEVWYLMCCYRIVISGYMPNVQLQCCIFLNGILAPQSTPGRISHLCVS